MTIKAERTPGGAGFYAGPYTLPMTEPIMVGDVMADPGFMMRHDDGTIVILAGDPDEVGERLPVAAVPWFGPKRKRGESMFKVPIEADARQHAQVRLFLAAPAAYKSLLDLIALLDSVDASGHLIDEAKAVIAAIEGA